MIVTHLLGDPHLGKPFINGVPLHRRGERERMQWEDFSQSLLKPCDLHVCMGDLFDKRHVPYDVIVTAARVYKDTAALLPNTEFVVIRGNHDASRDDEVTSAYDVFAAIMEGTKNVHVLENAPVILEGHCFIPWHPHRTAADVVPKGSFRAVYGHWDVIDFGNENPNLIPIEKLKDQTPAVFTGHDHNKRSIHGGLVHVTGSMQPYNHSEDPEGKLYVTITHDQLNDASLRDRCVRLILRPGDVAPADLDCLQLSIKRVEEDTPIEEVKLEAFDLEKIVREILEEAGVGPELKEELWLRIKS